MALNFHLFIWSEKIIASNIHPFAWGEYYSIKYSLKKNVTPFHWVRILYHQTFTPFHGGDIIVSNIHPFCVMIMKIH